MYIANIKRRLNRFSGGGDAQSTHVCSDCEHDVYSSQNISARTEESTSRRAFIIFWIVLVVFGMKFSLLHASLIVVLLTPLVSLSQFCLIPLASIHSPSLLLGLPKPSCIFDHLPLLIKTWTRTQSFLHKKLKKIVLLDKQCPIALEYTDVHRRCTP